VVVDASVAAKWVLAEEHADLALSLLRNGCDLCAPAHWLAEATNAVWAAAHRGDVDESQARERAAALVIAPVAILPLDRLAAAAMVIALRLAITVYDALYLAAAEAQNAVLITDDRRLLSAARADDRLARRAFWIGDGVPAVRRRGPR
jgi:predicted nucleic acid-binding protein